MKMTLRYAYWLLLERPHILSFYKTVELVREHGLSISRFGDGEMALLVLPNVDLFFQRNSGDLRQVLLESFRLRSDKLLICLPDGYSKMPFIFEKRTRLFYIGHIATNAGKIAPLIDRHYKYGNTNITRFYIGYKNKKRKRIEKKINALRTIWDKRNVVFIEGESTLLGVGNDLFDNCRSIRRIIAPSINAFGSIERIIESAIRHHRPRDLFLLALGPTASILAAKLCLQYGYQAIDIGHIDSEYYWFRINAKNKTPIPYKHTAEINNDGRITSAPPEDMLKYRSQIVEKIFPSK